MKLLQVTMKYYKKLNLNTLRSECHFPFQLLIFLIIESKNPHRTVHFQGNREME